MPHNKTFTETDAQKKKKTKKNPPEQWKFASVSV